MNSGQPLLHKSQGYDTLCMIVWLGSTSSVKASQETNSLATISTYMSEWSSYVNVLLFLLISKFGMKVPSNPLTLCFLLSLGLGS